MSTAATITPYVIRADAPAARFCGFRSADKFKTWATARRLRPPVPASGHRVVYRVADLAAALDADAATGFPKR